MTLIPVCLATAARSAGVAGAALCAGWALRLAMSGSGRRFRPLLLAALLVPFLTPSALTGYAYSNFSLSLVRHPVWNELLYSALLWLKLAPLAALVLYFAPGTLTPSALHCHRLGAAGGRLRRFLSEQRLRARLEWRAGATAFALAFLLAFGEFESASLLQVRSWTVTLFDAHAGGLALSESLKLTAVPLLIALAVLAPTIWMLARGRRLPARTSDAGPSAGAVLIGAGVALAALCWTFVTLLPMGMVLRDTWRGAALLVGDFVIGKDIAGGLLFAAVAAAGAWLAAGAALGRRLRPAAASLAAAPGLLGALTLALALVALFQTRALRPLYDTPLPLLLGLALLLLPFAVLLRIVLAMYRPGSAIHAAELLEDSASRPLRDRGGRIARFLRARGRFWAVFLLFCWGYFDVTASAILAPSATTPIFVRLYNLMHYGRITVLSAMVCAALAAPLAALGVAAAARAVYLRTATRG
jgi:ABC-type Fe3+ transport system permease subunit